jgi:hypothetical protein
MAFKRQHFQRIFWVYNTDIFIITPASLQPRARLKVNCSLLQITPVNCSRVSEFRDKPRILEYRQKLAQGEKGYFTEYKGRIIGSIWATTNATSQPFIARTYIRLMPREALIHDVVTGEGYRGMGVGGFMVGELAAALLSEHGSHKVIIDVNVRNKSSLRMMERVGLSADHQLLSVSMFGKPVVQKIVRRYR